ncbi:perlucin-like protein [Dreissena polymorpha]|uniref:C-type lectin domain-containing protein n=1 Tax=Dreissena polymorpha TaxID=45954 RepID=A0A9D4GEZ9_DREPO|nr:perlucin-like protein [Dreissena polymorpha]KAH3815622.1 hypothetical protein DPMN_144150 [Dreissena polymorpha]KAH3815667.1 hypothetical protein DPMN_144198 [Dreissena polymorpha]
MSRLQILFVGVAYLFNCTLGLKCPHGFEEYHQSCYMVDEDREDFSNAFQKCQAMNSELLKVNSNQELNYIKRLVGRSPQRVDGYWIGRFYDWTRGKWFESDPAHWLILNSDLNLSYEQQYKPLGYICETVAK